MNIIGLGVDIFETARMKNALRKHTRRSFLRRVFHPNELKTIGKGTYRKFALYFCVKEAFLKSVGMGWNEYTNFRDVEAKFSGKRISFKVYGRTAKLLKKLRVKGMPADYCDCGKYILAVSALYR